MYYAYIYIINRKKFKIIDYSNNSINNVTSNYAPMNRESISTPDYNQNKNQCKYTNIIYLFFSPWLSFQH